MNKLTLGQAKPLSLVFTTLIFLFSFTTNILANVAKDECVECNTSPVITCPSNYFGCPGDDTHPDNTGYATAIPGDSDCEEPVVTYTDLVMSEGPCTGQTLIKRIWFAEYPNNSNPWLFAECTQIILLEDVEIPSLWECPTDITVDLSVDCDATAEWIDPVPADNCEVESMTSNYSSGDTFPEGTTTVTYTLTDACGNTNSCSFTVTVQGECCTDPPVITCPPNYDLCPSEYISESCGTCYEDNIISGLIGISQATKTVFQYDIATGAMVSKVFPTLPNTYTIGVNPLNKDEFYFVGTDGNFYIGDFAAQTYSLIGPLNASSIPIGLDVTALGEVYAVSNTNEVFEIDINTGAATLLFTANMSVSRDITFLGMNQVWISGSFELIRFDINGNILETIAPLNGYGQGLAIEDCEEIAYYCNADGLYTINLSTGINQVLEDITSIGCNDLDSYLLDVPVSNLFYAQEDCATGDFMGYIDSNGDPYEPIGCTLMSSDCDFTAGDTTTDTGTATAVPGGASCGAPVISFEDVILSTGPCAGEIKIKRVWTATDSENPSLSSTCDQIINVRDVLGPVFSNCPSDIYVSEAGECEMPATWTEPTVTDNCELLSVSSSHSSGDMFPSGPTVVTYTATDACGNVTTCSFTVNVTDNCCTAPPVISCPSNIISCPGTSTSPSIMGYATATGDPSCGEPIISFTDTILSSGPCSGQKKLKRTWTATDPADPNISSSCDQIIELKDNTAPVFWDCPNDIWVSSGNTATWLDPMATDNCGIDHVTSNYSPGATFPVGTTEVIYTAYDNCGNSSSCWFSVVVESSGSLEITCPPDVTVGCDALINDVPLEPTFWSDCPSCNDVGYIPGFIYMGSLNGSSYYCSTSPATWETASDICNANGGYLACIGSAQENAFLANILTLQSAYIGLSDVNQEGNFTWSCGEPLGYTNWYPGQPNDYLEQQDYVEMLNNGQWNDQYASKKLEFIMELPCISVTQTSGPNLNGTLPPGIHHIGYYAVDACGNTATCSFNITVESSVVELWCPSDITVSNDGGGSGMNVSWQNPELNTCCNSSGGGGYIPGFIYMGSYNGSSYYCSLEPDIWENAQDVCAANGGYLACIGSASENAYLASLLQVPAAYIGLNDAWDEGQFTWDCGEPLNYTNWYPGQPNNFNNNQDYVELLSNGQWNDQYYYKPLEYIMEIPSCNGITQTAGPANGSYFPNGTTTVSYTASDCCGNVATCSFKVTVEETVCDPLGLSSQQGWIDEVMIDTFTNWTGNNGGYADFTNTCIPVEAGGSYDLRLSPEYSLGNLNAFWHVYIDYNMDGDFTDSGEFVAYGAAIGNIAGTLSLPYNIWNGDVTMRLVMHLGSYATSACDSEGSGEIEDYCLSITGGTLLAGELQTETRTRDVAQELTTSTANEFKIFPNPSLGNIRINAAADYNVDAEVYNTAGKLVKRFTANSARKEEISLAELENGVYFIRLIDKETEELTTKKIILNKE